MKVIELSKNAFATRIANPDNMSGEWNFLGNRPAVIDFYASWCGPCKLLTPILEEIASDYNGRVDIYKIDVDKEPDLANRFGIRSIPTLFFASPDNSFQRVSGFLPKEEISSIIDDML